MIPVSGPAVAGEPGAQGAGHRAPRRRLFGAFVLVESGSSVGAAVVFLILSPFHGIRSARRMGRAWPGAGDLNSADRAAVVCATRRGEAIDDPLLAPAVVEYADGLSRVAEEDRLRRPLVLLVTALAIVLAGYDTLTAPTGVLVASWLVVVLLLADFVWWPGRRSRVLTRAERARALALSARPEDRPASDS